ncbi:MAG TPA: EGF domain-containing protein [Polyangiales bacterium]|nr:EGF domain-containing protein [Polyangiales bacterium]
MQRALILQLLLVSTMAIASCASDDHSTPTEILVEIDAEPAVRATAQSLKVIVEGSDGIDKLTGRVKRLEETVKPVDFPKHVALVPLRGDEERVFVLTATVLDGDRKFVAQARLISGYVAGEVRFAKLMLEDSCIGVDSCDPLETCSQAMCLPALIDSSKLSENRNKPTLLSFAEQDAGSDAAAGGESDGAVDAGTGDAAMPAVSVIATAGDPCDVQGARACSGHGSKLPLSCNGGSWQTAEPCDDDQRCDSAEGAQLGTCQPIVTECAGETANVPFCADDALRTCPDLVSFVQTSCGAHAACVETGSKAVCSCLPGFKTSGGKCVDIDECASNHGGCDPVAICNNTPGTHSCACPAGYTGDGTSAGTKCEPSLKTLGLDVALSPAFDETVLDYTIDVPIATQTLSITPTVASGVTIKIDGVTQTSGSTWTSPTLGLNANPAIHITVSRSGYPSRDYTLAVTRGTQQAYAKALSSEAGDLIGGAIALSADGNTLAIGATGEDGGSAGVNGAVNNAVGSSGAVYVFTRSGSGWAQQAYIKASNPGGTDWFGESVSLSADGNTLAVGADNEGSAGVGVNPAAQGDDSTTGAGAVYVFTRSGSTWSQQAYIKATNTGANDAFGFATALSGDGNTLAVGAYGEASNGTPSDNSLSYAGAVYVYTRSGTTWTSQAYLKASDVASSQQFGISVALSGDGTTLAAGANGRSNYTGAAYVFVRSGNSWSEQQILTASNAEAQDSLGFMVRLSNDGNTLAAGAYGEDGPSNATSASGAAYVFVRSGTSWSEQAYLRASNAEASDNFGRRVAISGSGDVVVVTAYNEDSNGTGIGSAAEGDNSAANSGAAYVFKRSGTSWSQQAYVKSSNTEAGDNFGRNGLAISGDGTTFAVGSENEDSAGTTVNGNTQSDNSASNAGAVYVYR